MSDVENRPRRVAFLTGTRADFGKLKPLMQRLQADPAFDVHVFVTGMHMLSKYGYTCEEVDRLGFRNVHRYINQNASDNMDHVLAKTIVGLSDYVHEVSPEMLIVHGDRVEALAGATVGALNNILVGHVEGGEVSGTVDELIRHAVSKLSHLHFVAHDEARNRLAQLGERDDSVHVIGSPDIDVMNSPSLPDLDQVRSHYGIEFARYGILMFHPVTSELVDLKRQARVVVDEVLESGLDYVVIYPNNDHGSDLILDEYARLRGSPNIRIFPSMRFEYFIVLLRHAEFILGNSSAGVREAPHFGVPAINLGSRQNNRVRCTSVVNYTIEPGRILAAIGEARSLPRTTSRIFGDGNSAEHFHRLLASEALWRIGTQKYFIDRALA